jgi:hypothetical protein
MIGAELASFLQEGLGIYVGTRNAALEPNGARAAAASVHTGGGEMTVYVPAIAAGRVLDDLRTNQHIAVSFGRPADDRACQVKGVFIDAREARDDERGIVTAQWEAFVKNLDYIGIPPAATRGWEAWPAIAVRFKPTAVFDQTPGPGAGKPTS